MNRKLLVLITSILMAGLLASCSSNPVQVMPATPQRTLNASGTGEIYIVPDIAYINVGIHTEADDVTTALNNNNTQAQAISDALTSMGVDAKDIQTTSFNVSPMTTYAPDGTVSKKYFAVDNSVYVTVRDLSSLGKLLDTVVKSGANTINGISFDVKDKATVNAQARDLAIQNAIAEAQAIAKAAGVTLGALQSINVSTSTPIAQSYAPKAYAVGGGGSVPVSAGQLTVSVDANLVYEIK